MAVLRRILTGVLGAAAVVGLPGVAAAEPTAGARTAAAAATQCQRVDTGEAVRLRGGGRRVVRLQLERVDVRAAALGRVRLQRCHSGCAGRCEHCQRRIGRGARLRQHRWPVFGAADAAKPLPAGSRISYQLSAVATTARRRPASTASSQSGFVVGAAGSSILNESTSAALSSRRHEPVRQLTARGDVASLLGRQLVHPPTDSARKRMLSLAYDPKLRLYSTASIGGATSARCRDRSWPNAARMTTLFGRSGLRKNGHEQGAGREDGEYAGRLEKGRHATIVESSCVGRHATIDAAIRPASCAAQNPEPCTSWPGFSAARPR